jgi:hypothetical protein
VDLLLDVLATEDLLGRVSPSPRKLFPPLRLRLRARLRPRLLLGRAENGGGSPRRSRHAVRQRGAALVAGGAADEDGDVPSRSLPRSFWILWCGTLSNRIGGFVLPFLAIYLSRERGQSIAAAGAVASLYGAGMMIPSSHAFPARAFSLGLPFSSRSAWA